MSRAIFGQVLRFTHAFNLISKQIDLLQAMAANAASYMHSSPFLHEGI